MELERFGGKKGRNTVCSENSEQFVIQEGKTGRRWKDMVNRYIPHTPKYFPQFQVFTKQSVQQVCKGGESLRYINSRISQRHIVFL